MEKLTYNDLSPAEQVVYQEAMRRILHLDDAGNYTRQEALEAFGTLEEALEAGAVIVG